MPAPSPVVLGKGSFGSVLQVQATEAGPPPPGDNAQQWHQRQQQPPPYAVKVASDTRAARSQLTNERRVYGALDAARDFAPVWFEQVPDGAVANSGLAAVPGIGDRVLVMSREGMSLATARRQCAPSHWAAVLPLVAACTLDAVHALHLDGILHRDITPHNIVVDVEGGTWRAKLIDFGLALSARSTVPERWMYLDGTPFHPEEYVDSATHCTLPNAIIGTFRYMSPAVHLGHTYRAIDDVVGLLYTLCSVYAGGLPWDAQVNATPSPTEHDHRRLAEAKQACVPTDLAPPVRCPSGVRLMAAYVYEVALADRTIDYTLLRHLLLDGQSLSSWSLSDSESMTTASS